MNPDHGYGPPDYPSEITPRMVMAGAILLALLLLAMAVVAAVVKLLLGWP